MQQVGAMSVLPLIADKKYQSDEYAAPNDLAVRSDSYGDLGFQNSGDKIVIIPAHAMYITKQRAQDHAMTKAGVVNPGSSKVYDDAACVESSQAGHLRPEKREMSILPWSMREFATSKRGLVSYDKLWSTIGVFNFESGVNHHNRHLSYFYDKFKDTLDEFVAQFEVVPNQVGAIILINGTVFGVERTPSYEYFKKIFETLIRSCYGAAALRISQGINPAKVEEYKTYPHIDTNVTLIAGIEKALKTAIIKEQELAKKIIDGLLDDELSEEIDESDNSIVVKTVNNTQLIGQTIDDGGNPIYTSLVVKKDWLKNKKWFQAEMFKL